jgi:hypothetical protein
MPTPENTNITLAQLARGRVRASLSNAEDAENWLDQIGAHRAARILRKAAVPASSTNDSDINVMTGAWSQSMTSASVFYKLLDNGFRKLPVHQRIGLATSSPSASVVPEGKAAPISRSVIGHITLEPAKIVSMLVMTRELALEPGAEGLFTKELRAVIGESVDAAFIGMLGGTGATTIPSSGTSAANAVADVRAAMLAIDDVGSQSRLVWLLAPDVAQMGSALGASGPVFPGLTPAGGDIRGVMALVSAGIPSGQAVLLDAGQIAGAGGEVDVQVAQSASVEMSDAPTGSSATPTGAQLVSMFQTNAVAMRAVAAIAAEVLRDGAISIVTGINWGAGP